MNRDCFIRTIQVTIFALALVAVFKELEKPEEKRRWHGKVAGFVPYDFRLPSIDRLLEAYWNPYEKRVLTPEVFGIGWAINIYALLENLGIIRRADVSEESFLMPTKSIKNVLTNLPSAES